MVFEIGLRFGRRGGAVPSAPPYVWPGEQIDSSGPVLVGSS